MDGTVSLFGFPSTSARLQVRPRTTGWRALRASLFMGGALLLAPAVGMIPPHAPWVVAVLAVGGVLGVRKWRERFTVLAFEGTCPKCGEALSLPSGIPLRPTMTVSCEGCRHESRLTPSLPPSSPGKEPLP